VRDEEGGGVDAREEGAKHVLHFGAGEGIKSAERLVHEEERGFSGEGAGESDALALASGELVRIALRKGGGIEADGGEQFVTATGTFCTRAILRFKDQGNVAFGAEVWEETGFLNDVSDAAAKRDEIDVARGLSVEEDVAAGGLNHPVDGAQERGFAGAAATKEDGGRSFFDGERDVVEQTAALGSYERNIAELDSGGHP
jgi:hypothetical protein